MICISVKESYLFVPCSLIRASNPEHHTHKGRNLCFIRAFDPLTFTLFSYGRILHALWHSQNFCSPGFFVSKPTPQQWHNSAGLGPKRATFWKGPLKIDVSFGPREGSYSIQMRCFGPGQPRTATHGPAQELRGAAPRLRLPAQRGGCSTS